MDDGGAEREKERRPEKKVLNAPDRARLIAPSIPYSILLLLPTFSCYPFLE